MDIQKLLDVCAEKTAKNITKMHLGLREYPSAVSGDYYNVSEEETKPFHHIMNWTASFFTGMVMLAFEQTGDLSYLKWLNRQYTLYYKKVFDNSEENMHDTSSFHILQQYIRISKQMRLRTSWTLFLILNII